MCDIVTVVSVVIFTVISAHYSAKGLSHQAIAIYTAATAQISHNTINRPPHNNQHLR